MSIKMTEILDMFKFKVKILAISLLPLIAFAYLSLMNVNTNYHTYGTTQTLNILVNIVDNAEELMHELEKERAFASGYHAQKELDKKGNEVQTRDSLQGEVADALNFQNELKNQSKITDKSIHALELSFQQTKSTIQKLPKLDIQIKELIKILNRLPNIRKQTADVSLNINIILNYYNKLDLNIKKLMIYLVNYSHDADISRNVNTLLILTDIKSLLGYEQVTLGEVFQNDLFTKKLFQKYISVTANIKAFINLFKLVANTKNLNQLEAVLNGNRAKAVQKYRLLASKKNAFFGIKAIDWINAQSQYMDQLQRINQGIKKDLIDKSNLLAKEALTSLLINAIGIIIILSISGILIALLTSKLTKRINYVISIIKKVSTGNLDVQINVTGQDEVTNILMSVRDMSQKLNGTVIAVQNSAANIQKVSFEMDEQNQQLASRTQESSTNLQETSASMEQMSSTINLSSDNAQEVSSLGRQASEIANKSAQTVEQAVKAMSEVDEASGKISEIIEVIEEISFQTNLLALNAAVEAASAGEHGKGFAVVADEVRNLSQRSSESSKQIKTLILNTVEKVKNGSSLVNQTGEAFSQIIDSIDKVSKISEAVAASAQEQAQGVTQVNVAISELDQGTQDNTTLVQKLKQSGTELKNLSQKLNNAVDFFITRTDPKNNKT